jgi:ABC-2 type transport system ATP-binding protein
MPAISVEGVRHSYGERTALRDIHLRVETGEIFGLLGPNGGGKTTLFRILSTLMRPDGGSARILDLDVAASAGEVRRHIGVVFQSPSLDGKLTVLENLIHQGHLYGLRGRPLKQRAEGLLDKFRLADRAGDRTETLSGGLQRRVEVAKALLHEPEVLLLDEPSTGLDPGARRDLLDMLRSSGATVLLTTHILDEAENASRLAILHEGDLVALGSPDELKGRIGGDVVYVSTRHPETVIEAVRSRFHVQPTLVDGRIRVEIEDGHRFLPGLFETFGGEILSATVGRPTLEDVFIRLTGTRFG